MGREMEIGNEADTLDVELTGIHLQAMFQHPRSGAGYS